MKSTYTNLGKRFLDLKSDLIIFKKSAHYLSYLLFHLAMHWPCCEFHKQDLVTLTSGAFIKILQILETLRNILELITSQRQNKRYEKAKNRERKKNLFLLYTFISHYIKKREVFPSRSVISHQTWTFLLTSVQNYNALSTLMSHMDIIFNWTIVKTD